MDLVLHLTVGWMPGMPLSLRQHINLLKSLSFLFKIGPEGHLQHFLPAAHPSIAKNTHS